METSEWIGLTILLIGLIPLWFKFLEVEKEGKKTKEEETQK